MTILPALEQELLSVYDRPQARGRRAARGLRSPAVRLRRLGATAIVGVSLGCAAAIVAVVITVAQVRSPARMPVPGGTAGAPPGMRSATGYGSYYGCGDFTSSGCLGSIPADLRRPLHLPTLAPSGPCPVTKAARRISFLAGAIGPGPVYLGGTYPDAKLPVFLHGRWADQQIVWAAARKYQGPLLIRGRQLGGPGVVGFDGGSVPYVELQLNAPGVSTPGEPDAWRLWLSLTKVRGSGCYGYQIDGTNFSEVIVVRAVVQRLPR